LGRLFHLTPKLATLLCVGTTICGSSAIAITAPVIQAKEEDTSYAITTVTLWGLVAMLVYPTLAKFFSLAIFPMLYLEILNALEVSALE
jgi:uncharacterized membrane protein YadS